MTQFVLSVSVRSQRMVLFTCRPGKSAGESAQPIRKFVVSTSRFGVGQLSGSNRTPIGLHRIAEKIGAGHPIGTVFQGRQPVGYTWKGLTDGAIAHRIMWLAGVEDGINRGGSVDSHDRYIYIHGVGNELTLGRPASRGCIHLSAADLMPLFDRLPSGTLVWISI